MRLCVLFFLLSIGWQHCRSSEAPNRSESQLEAYHECNHSSSEGIRVVNVNRAAVDPIIIALFIVLASIAKLIFHLSKRLTEMIPESLLLIVLGLITGALLLEADVYEDLHFTSDLFFLYLLPPIVLESGYFLKTVMFFNSLWIILLYAVIGTLWNTFSLGVSLYAVSAWGWVPGMENLKLVEALFFASLIAAVDPVAVLAVFEDMHVNEQLHILVFGESILNDAVSVVLYRMFEAFTEKPEVEGKDIGLGFASFFTVSFGALTIGIAMGLLASFLTKYSKHVAMIEPIIILGMGYLTYLVTDLLHWSGIISGLFCAVLMRHYAESNMERASTITVRQLLKNLALMSETIIFIFLGLHTVTSDNHSWNTAFILFTLLFVIVYRTIGVFALTALVNPMHHPKIRFVDQFTMAYGGLRGAVSFSLVLIISDCFPYKNVMFTTTVAVIYFTVFVQGITIKPIVKALHVRLVRKSGQSVSYHLHDRVFTNIVSGITNIAGHLGFTAIKMYIIWINQRYINPLVLRKQESADQEIVKAFVTEQYAAVERRLKEMEKIGQHQQNSRPYKSSSSSSSSTSSCVSDQ
jgi:sodium/hydrogen exchanger-like protein 3